MPHGGITLLLLYKWRLEKTLCSTKSLFVIARIAMDAANRLSAIAAFNLRGQLKNEIQELHTISEC